MVIHTDNEAKIQELQEQLERHEEAARTFCKITNDLNNLIAAMKGQAQLAQAEAKGEELHELIRVVLVNTDKSQNVIQLGLNKIAQVDEYEIIEPVNVIDSPSASGIRILVVDDEESMRNVLNRILTKSGYEVTTVATGRGAIECASDQEFDVAFLDLNLGDMNGVEVFKEIREVSPHTHIIFVSGDPALEQVKQNEGIRHMAGFIKKPFEIHEINELVSCILTMRAALVM